MSSPTNTTVGEPDHYVTVNQACARFSMSRSSIYRMLADPDSGLSAILVRIPPGTGRLRVPLRAFEAWLRAHTPAKRRRRAS